MTDAYGEQSAETTVSTFCRICESRCGIEVTVKEGRVRRIGPDKPKFLLHSVQIMCEK